MPATGTARRIPMTVTFLEMTAKPSALPPPLPRGKIAFLRSEHPPVHFYRYLYDTVGGKYFWVDRKKISDDKLAEIIQAPTNHALYSVHGRNPGRHGRAGFPRRRQRQYRLFRADARSHRASGWAISSSTRPA